MKRSEAAGENLKGTACLENSLAKLLNRHFPYDQSLSSRCLLKERKTRVYVGRQYTNVYNSCICSSQKLETIQMPINR